MSFSLPPFFAACPTPSVCARTVAVVCTADPWALSLDSLLILIGLIVGALGAAGTILVAWLALAATNRANRLEKEARERSGRVALASSVEAYLGGWEPQEYFDPGMKGEDSANALIAGAAGVSRDTEVVAQWVVKALRASVAQIVEENATVDTVEGDRLLGIHARGARAEVRRRVTAWVATGSLDQSPLLSPTPTPPPFPIP